MCSATRTTTTAHTVMRKMSNPLQRHSLPRSNPLQMRRQRQTLRPMSTMRSVMFVIALLCSVAREHIAAFHVHPIQRHLSLVRRHTKPITTTGVPQPRTVAIANDPRRPTRLSQSQRQRRRSRSSDASKSLPPRPPVSSSSAASAMTNAKANGKRAYVRGRVRRVLAIARDRTGIANGSDAADASVIADAASIGGGDYGPPWQQSEAERTAHLERVQPQPKPPGSPLASSKKERATLSSEGSSAKSKSSGRNNRPSYGASTYSPPIQSLPKSYTEIDAFVGDASAAFSLPPDPFPFTLPALSADEEDLLRRGERVQFQSDMGRQGSGYVVMDVAAPPPVVWECLLDFHSYPQLIPTVRDIRMFTNTHLAQDYRHERPVEYEDGTVATLRVGVPSVTRAAFTLSKFRLNIAAIHKYTPHDLGDYMIFTLDPACTNMVMQAAKGVWHTQRVSYGNDGEEFTRVWLLCELRVSNLLPKWIVDYAARRAMPRATTWLKPQVEAASGLWLKRQQNDAAAAAASAAATADAATKTEVNGEAGGVAGEGGGMGPEEEAPPNGEGR